MSSACSWTPTATRPTQSNQINHKYNKRKQKENTSATCTYFTYCDWLFTPEFSWVQFMCRERSFTPVHTADVDATELSSWGGVNNWTITLNARTSRFKLSRRQQSATDSSCNSPHAVEPDRKTNSFVRITNDCDWVKTCVFAPLSVSDVTVYNLTILLVVGPSPQPWKITFVFWPAITPNHLFVSRSRSRQWSQ